MRTRLKAIDEEVKDYIMRNFYYDNLNNNICWLKDCSEVKFGSNKFGYLKKQIVIKPNTYRAVCYHQIIFYLYTGLFNSKLRINHIDGNVSNNNISNLELITPKQNNSYRTKLQTNNTSGFNGVSWFKRDSKWRAYIKAPGKLIHLGYFNTVKDAVAARDKYIIDNKLDYYTLSTSNLFKN